jgi:hypothetical protein
MTKDLKIEINMDGHQTGERLEKLENLYTSLLKLPREQRRKILCEILDGIVSAWEGPNMAKSKDGLYVFYTGYLSINKKLITAFMRSEAFLFVDHVSSGGAFYAIAVTEEAKEKLVEIEAEFITKLWSCVQKEER